MPDIEVVTFEELFEKYQKPIQRYLMNRVHNQEIAEDLCQEAFIKYWEYNERKAATTQQNTGSFNKRLVQSVRTLCRQLPRSLDLWC